MGAQFGNHSRLPSNHDMARMLRDGETTLADLGAAYGVSAATIRGRLHSAGWEADGQPTGEAARQQRTPLFTAPEWMDQALCAQVGGDGFFPDRGSPDAPVENTLTSAEAKKLCALCPVRAQCLEYALANDERWGIWGGLSERERRRLKKGLPPVTRDVVDWALVREWARDQRIRVADVGRISPKVVEAYRAAHPEAS